ncbi:MAG: septal ring lytic transglycosylase RlpA family protein [Thermoanaerobaculia bacterium]
MWLKKRMQPYFSFKFYKLLILFFFISCTTSVEIKKEGIFEEEGLASWYGEEYHGEKTSSGETFNMYDFTAAHRTLPFGTFVYVYSYDTGKTIKVRINDRGPFLPGRIIDLSYAAAKELGIISMGISKVKISANRKPEENFDIKKYNLVIQVGAFKIKENAEKLKENLNKKYKKVYTEDFNEFRRVLIGPFRDEKEIEKVYNSLKEEGFSPIIRKI